MSITGKKRTLKESDATDSSDPSSSSLDSDADADSFSSGAAAAEPVQDSTAKSHAALRKERKLARKKPDQPTQEKDTLPKRKVDTPASRQNSIWVGNLNYKTTPEALKKVFDGVGEITRVHLPTKNNGPGAKKFNVRGDNMGFAYVDFATSDAKTIAIALSETHLDGRKLLIKDGNDFTGRPSAPASQPASKTAEDSPLEGPSNPPQPGTSKYGQKILRSQKQPPAPTLFMGNLPFEIVVDDIRSMLEVHRKVKQPRQKEKDAEGQVSQEGPGDDVQPPAKWLRKIRMGTFEDTGKCKGWAFLDFVDVAEATVVLTNPKNHKMNGRNLTLEYASPDAVRRGGHFAPSADSDRPQKKRRVDGPRVPRSAPDRRADGTAPADTDLQTHDSRPERKVRERVGKDGRARPRPGAALAMAKRENVAIVESEGKKIKF